MNELIFTPDDFYNKHLVCADENSNACDPKTKILICKKCGAGFCSLNNCLTIHSSSMPTRGCGFTAHSNKKEKKNETES